jgi:threonine dehydrogenase-like Zn-dependent dehydrogenase
MTDETSSTSARAAVLAAPGEIRIATAAPPRPGPGEVRVRLQGCGVCASNIPVWQGREWFEYPLPAGSPGHEGWGVIDAVGPVADDTAAVAALLPGTRVALLSGHAFADYDVAAADAVVPLPAGLDGRPFPGEPLACAMNAFRRGGIEPGQRVAVLGTGFLGSLLTALARGAGARVLAVSRRDSSLALAEAQGAEARVRWEDDFERTAGQAAAWTGGEGFERVIECTGHQAGLDLATGLAAVRGRIVVVGYHQDGPRRIDMQQWNWKGLDVVNAHERDPAVYARGLREAVAAVAAGRLDPQPLLTHRFRLDELGEALDAAAERPEGFVKAWIDLAAG